MLSSKRFTVARWLWWKEFVNTDGWRGSEAWPGGAALIQLAAMKLVQSVQSGLTWPKAMRSDICAPESH